MSVMRKELWIVLLVVLVIAGVLIKHAADDTTPGPLPPMPNGVVESEPEMPKPAEDHVGQKLVEGINGMRKRYGLAPLRVSEVLTTAARDHAYRMADRGTLSHTLGGDPGERIKTFGYRWVWCAENIAFNQSTEEEAVSGWMESEGHRRNILSPKAEELGVGVMFDAGHQPYYCAIFAKPLAGE